MNCENCGRPSVRIADLARERDEAWTELRRLHVHLNERVSVLEGDADLQHKRAVKAERLLEHWMEECRNQCNITDALCDRLKVTETQLAAATKAREEAERNSQCGTCCGTPHASGKPCICGGRNTAQAEAEGLRMALYEETKAREEAEAREAKLRTALGNLVEAVERMDSEDANCGCRLCLRHGPPIADAKVMP